MSYAVESPVVPATAPSRPATVVIASTLLAVMGLGGLGYAVATLSITPGVVDRFRDAAAGATTSDVDGLVTVLWIAAALGLVLGVILVALYVVLALGLRRGSNASRVGAWVVAGLGLLAGLGSTAAVLIQRSGDEATGTIGAALVGAYPGGWIGLNIALAVAQVIGYAAVGVLLFVSPGTYFGRTEKAKPDPYAAPAGYPAPGSFGPPPGPGYGPSPGPGYGPPQGPGYGPPQGPGYGPPQGPGYGPPPGPGYGPPPGFSGPGYGPPPGPGYGPPPPGYGPPAGFPPPGYGPPPGAPAGYGPPPPEFEQSAYAPPPGYDPVAPVAPPGYPSSQDLPPNPPSAASAPPETPPAQAQQGPDDEYWSRPPS
jgi:hypothetical protein